MTARVGVITFPGSLDDADAARAVARAGAEPVPLWHGDRDLRGLAAVILPGGFSYGDYLRCGAIARFAPVMGELIPAARAGLPVLGICNGFQILCEAHLLPGALTRNAGLRFIDRVVRVRIEDTRTPWTAGYAQDQEIELVLKSGEGAYVADPATLARLTSAGQVVARYAGGNPNGSVGDIAGVRNEAGNVVGLMPHPEHAIDALTGPGTDGLGFFTSVLRRWRRRRHREPVTRADTVSRAAATPGQPQPYAELGLTSCGVRADRRAAGPPADRRGAGHLLGHVERALLLQVVQGPPAPVRGSAPPSPALLAGIGQNAGVVDIGQGYAVTFKVESHNHPSYVEPFQGAATGVGGIVRDILAMGARPVAVMDSLRFGPADAPDTHRVLPGVVAGISFYGNCLGLPNIGGELAFDPCYSGNPLVNALCVGVMRHQDLKLAAARGTGQPGDPVRLPDRPGRHRRRVGAGQRHVRWAWWGGSERGASGPASRSATRSWRSC